MALGVCVDFTEHFRAAQCLHLIQDPVAALEDISRGGGSGPVLGVRQDGGEDGGIAARQARGGLMEKALGGPLATVSAVPELGDVEIDLEDAALGPKTFDEHGEVGFQSLAEVAA